MNMPRNDLNNNLNRARVRREKQRCKFSQVTAAIMFKSGQSVAEKDWKKTWQHLHL